MPERDGQGRRPGPRYRLFGALFGLMLCCGWLPVQAAGPDNRHPSAEPVYAAACLDCVPALMTPSPYAMPGGTLISTSSLSPLLTSASSINANLGYLPVGQVLLGSRYLGDDLQKIRHGLGVDLLLPAVGYFHLNLYNGRDGLNGGMRWRLNPQGEPVAGAADRFWSLGGTLALERNDPWGHRQLMFVPQLTFNVDALLPVPGRMQAVLSYHDWRSTFDDGLPQQGGRVPQLSLRWSF
ncbi:MAG: hypothetical protein P4L83_11770 [Nevskia sp.]|nr:hypothetical protein [Nevskia sp.]